MRNLSPCYDCEDRHYLCHMDCATYQEFHSEMEKRKDYIFRQKNNLAHLYRKERFGKNDVRRPWG